MALKLLEDFENPKKSSLRESPSAQEIFEDVMSQELLTFLNVMNEAHFMTLDELSKKSIHFQNRNSKANRMNEMIRGLLSKEYPDDVHENKHRRFFLRRGNYRFYFKKLANNLKPRHNETPESQTLIQQNLGLSFSSEPITIWIGYIPSATWEELTTLCAVYIRNGSVVWTVDLRLHERGHRQLPVPYVEPTIEDDQPLIVTPKKRGDQEGAGV